MLNISEEIKLAFSENKFAIILSAGILFGSLFVGYYFEPYLHNLLDPVLISFMEQIQSQQISQPTFQGIFLNNIRIVFLMFILGAVFYVSALLLVVNGALVGYIIALSDDFFNALLLIIPHGIFEFPSLALASASGFVLFNFIFRCIKTFSNQNDFLLKKLFKSFFINFDKLKQAVILLMIASILMVIAGFVETYLTVPIANFIISILS